MNNHIALIVGTTMGNAEAVADELEPVLTEQGYQVYNSIEPDPDQLSQCDKWVVICSTHGAGEVPDNLHPWLQWLDKQADLSQHQYALCGIGDSSYDTFCGALDQIEPKLRSKQMISFVDKIKIDVQHLDLPEDKALAWIEQWPKPIL